MAFFEYNEDDPVRTASNSSNKPFSKFGRIPLYLRSAAAFTIHLTAMPTPELGHTAIGTKYFADLVSFGRMYRTAGRRASTAKSKGLGCPYLRQSLAVTRARMLSRRIPCRVRAALKALVTACGSLTYGAKVVGMAFLANELIMFCGIKIYMYI